MRCFVLGNGRSRLAIQPSELIGYGKIYGCNAIYREFDPDFLIAVDPKMVMELNSVGYQHTHQVWTNGNSRYKTFRGLTGHDRNGNGNIHLSSAVWLNTNAITSLTISQSLLLYSAWIFDFRCLILFPNVYG